MHFTECPCHDCEVLDQIENGEDYFCACDMGPIKEACDNCPQNYRCDVAENPDMYP